MKNVEIKAKCPNPAQVRSLLLGQEGIHFAGTDWQTDTYFEVPEGRLKLREGNIERSLIFYRRENQAAARRSDVLLYPATDIQALKNLLVAALPVLRVVKKSREIYFIGQTKFHLDTLEDLGTFLEIEVIDASGEEQEEPMRQLCQSYLELLGVRPEQFLDKSYSDMVI